MINSHDEWSALKEVVVGTVANFSPPLEIANGNEGLLAKAQRTVKKAYPSTYLEEVAEDLEGVVSVLRSAGVKVHRPEWTERGSSFSTPNWTASGFDIYNMRDLHIVFGNTLISSASSARFRLFEHYALQNLIYEHHFGEALRWIYAPVPRLAGEYLREYDRTLTSLESHEDARHKELSSGLTEKFHRLDEKEILFDAANVIRVGKDILYLVSSTGNQKAAVWLKSVLGAEYRVHVTNSYRSSHLDSTILPLRPGLVLLNHARVNAENCPAIFRNWEQLFFADVAPVPEEEVKLHREVRLPVFHELRAMGVHSNLEHISSPWAGLNIFSIDHGTVMVHDRQVALIRKLESRGFAVVPIRMRHCYTMLGGLHCTTLDLFREGDLGDYV